MSSLLTNSSFVLEPKLVSVLCPQRSYIIYWKLNKNIFLPFRFRHQVIRKYFLTAGSHPSEAEMDYSFPWALLHPVHISFITHTIYYCTYFITIVCLPDQTISSLKFRYCILSTYIFPAPET